MSFILFVLPYVMMGVIAVFIVIFLIFASLDDRNSKLIIPTQQEQNEIDERYMIERRAKQIKQQRLDNQRDAIRELKARGY